MGEVNDAGLREYYARRAHEYENIYHRPERQSDLAALRKLLRELLAGEDVLEVACGTGYWTEVVAQSARSILAVDINESVLEIARKKTYPVGRVRIEPGDAWYPDACTGEFTAGLAAFWISHVSRSEMRGFLDRLRARLRPGGLVVLVENKYVEGNSTPVSRTDSRGNTFQIRELDDGSRYEVRKNFLTKGELLDLPGEKAREIRLEELTYYWCLGYRI